MKRYLITYSYIGTHFRTGIQKQFENGVVLNPETSIQGLLELALQRFHPVNVPNIVLSSRTDQGVHALSTTAHVDLERPGASTHYDPPWIMHGMNRTFTKLKADVRIQKIQIVPDIFHARFNARSRTYLYRFAVRKKDSELPPDKELGYGSPIPISEWQRCYFVQKQEFDTPSITEAARLFVGTHDFRTFMGRPSQQPDDKVTVRTILNLEFRPGRSLLSASCDPLIDHYTFWEVVCEGRSFLYRQVRRIVGALIAVAQGRLQVSDVRSMIEEPNPDKWTSVATVAPAYGLYLQNVKYDLADLQQDAGEALLEERKRKLKPTETKVTLSSGQVFVETKSADGGSVVQTISVDSSPGFVVDEKPDLQVGHVLPGLLVGSQDVASDSNLVTSLCVTHVLSVGVDVIPPVSSINHHYLHLLDLPETNALPVLQEACDFLHSALSSDSKAQVLVHCNAGVSRAPTVVTAYLIKYKKMTVNEALNLVKNCRPCMKPNVGFIQQLNNFYKDVTENLDK